MYDVSLKIAISTIQRICAQCTLLVFILFFFTGDSMANTKYTLESLHGMPFSTYDQNNDPHSYCVSSRSCGLLFNFCADVVLNGPWGDYAWFPEWYPVVHGGIYVRGTLMMIRPN